MRMYLTMIASVALGLAAVGNAASAKSVSKFSAKLSTRAEVPKAKGNGKGTAVITFDTKKNQICWKVNVSGIDKPLSVYVHLGAPGKAGPGVIALGSGFKPKGCEIARASIIKPVLKHPTSYYVNVHTRKHLNGAIRGQLRVH
jgi:hypothetical protein